jgi:predicted enzyme related to lactoylglutathione lyase
MNRVIHFEIYTEDPEAVQPFYRDVFGWQFKKFEGGPIDYWLVTTGDDKDSGINGGLARPRDGQSPGTLNTITVSSLDETMKKIEQRGGRICVLKMAIAGLRGRFSRQRFRDHGAGYERAIIRAGLALDYDCEEPSDFLDRVDHSRSRSRASDPSCLSVYPRGSRSRVFQLVLSLVKNLYGLLNRVPTPRRHRGA